MSFAQTHDQIDQDQANPAGPAPAMDAGEPEPRSLAIADYGLLADCNGSALVANDGSIDWLCLPRFDSPAVFARILDPSAGHWSITPAMPFTVERRYLPGTLVLETTFTTRSGIVRLTDALVFARGQRNHDLGLDSPHQLLRLIEGVAGEVKLSVEIVPRPEYGLVRPLLHRTDDGFCTYGAPNQFAMSSGVPLDIGDDTARATVTVSHGDEVGFALCWSDTAHPGLTPCHATDVAARIADTADGWRSWEHAHDIYRGALHDAVRLGARVLKGLTYRPTGAIVAAPTTSLPEEIGGERNWDYRYAWVRDACLTLEALYIGACPIEAADFVRFMVHSAGAHIGSDDALQIMFGVGGEHDLSERTLPHLRGWRDSAPVRIGNGAWTQSQLDVYGELLSALHLYREQLGTLPPETQRFAAFLADSASRQWHLPDSGMWEMRGDLQHHLSSKLLCWVALDRAVALANDLGPHAREAEWAAARDQIREAILTRGWNESVGAYTQTLDGDRLDAAALLMPLVGFLPATDPRMRSTIETIARELTADGLVLRYRNESGTAGDGLSGDEGAFVICSFWLVSCLALAGEIDRAEALFARLAGAANDLGLLAEEIAVYPGTAGGNHPSTIELLGNFPQAFSHVGLITAAWQLDRARGTTDVVPAPSAPLAASSSSLWSRLFRR
jgi:GH15 family glucan-1,4-alpha-glucosidase